MMRAPQLDSSTEFEQRSSGATHADLHLQPHEKRASGKLHVAFHTFHALLVGKQKKHHTEKQLHNLQADYKAESTKSGPAENEETVVASILS
jgi:hypothetical protein